MMITKETFVSMITTMCIAIDESRWMCENCKRLTENDKKELMEGCDYQKDLITMITVVTFDCFGVIRDYLYERDENDEYFFGIPKGNKLEVYLLSSPEDLYEYLAEESEGFCLIAKKAPRPTEVGALKICLDYGIFIFLLQRSLVF